MLKESLNAQRILENENSGLKEEIRKIKKQTEEMSIYLKTQDHINILKLRERDLLLKELTEQVTELRAQIKRDQNLLLEIKKGKSLPIIERQKPNRIPIPIENSNSKKLKVRVY